MDIAAFCANCGEKIYRTPTGLWRHEFRNFLECDEDSLEDHAWWLPEAMATPDVQVSI